MEALHSPLSAVGVAWMTLVVGLGILEDKTVGALQPIRAFLHTVRSIFEVTTFHTLVRALREGEGDDGGWGTRGHAETVDGE